MTHYLWWTASIDKSENAQNKMLLKAGEFLDMEERASEARAAAMKRERPKGEWIEGEYVGEVGYEIKWRCSSCGFAVLSEEYPAWHFCPNCGAEMRKEVNNGKS